MQLKWEWKKSAVSWLLHTAPNLILSRFYRNQHVGPICLQMMLGQYDRWLILIYTVRYVGSCKAQPICWTNKLDHVKPPLRVHKLFVVPTVYFFIVHRNNCLSKYPVEYRVFCFLFNFYSLLWSSFLHSTLHPLSTSFPNLGTLRC